tara:strand:- start:585 stop:1031 length:447 start_codon:yes stop_codon:yes gene_type:complete
MAMLAEIALANSLYKVVSTAFKNGKSIYEMGSQLTDYFSATHEVQKKAGDSSSKGTALEAYQFAEQQRIQRANLEWHMKKSRLNGWTDFVRFEAEWHRQRREEEAAVIKKKARQAAKLQKDIALGINVGICMILALGILFGIAIYIKG